MRTQWLSLSWTMVDMHIVHSPLLLCCVRRESVFGRNISRTDLALLVLDGYFPHIAG